jgi:hypothetical protein
MIQIKVKSFDARVQLITTRMPFRYGPAELTRCPHLYLTVTIEDSQGRTAQGIAADNLPPLWFDKGPAKSYRQQVSDQIQVLSWACEAAAAEGHAEPFRLWLSTYRQTQALAGKAGLPPLLGGFGPALVERAIDDAVGRLLGLPFHILLSSGALGIDLGLADGKLIGINPAAGLPEQPLSSVAVRHTVGLSDPIRSSEISTDDRLNDGLPQSLDEVIRFYGVRHFKLKVGNRGSIDLEQLEAIAGVLDGELPNTAYACTIDGNEMYEAMEQLRPLIEGLRSRPGLQRLASSILFIEQPLARSAALDPERCCGIERLGFPVIIDESDDSIESLPKALSLGYGGSSHKNCKGPFKGVINAARLHNARQDTGREYILSAEDLTNVGPVALNQDLAVLCALGIPHAERNGHHYFRGLSHISQATQQKMVDAYPGLYCQGSEYVRLNICDGLLDCRSLNHTPGLGSIVWPGPEHLISVRDFDPTPLGDV